MKNILFLVSILLFSCKNKKEETPKTEVENTAAKTISLTDEQLKIMQIELGKAEQRSMQGGIVAMGKVTILANDMADISAQFKGRVERILAHEGQFVKKGEILMELTSPEVINLQREYLLAQAELFYLEKELDRQQQMVKENVGATKPLQEVQSKVMIQKAMMRTAASTLNLAGIAPPQYEGIIVDKIQIRAPLAGYIDHFPIALGTAVLEGQKLAHIKSFSDPHADIAVYEKDLQNIKAGQSVRIKFNDPSMPEAMGEIEFIGREVDPMTKAVTIHVPFKTPTNKVVATDMIVTATIETARNTTFALPESAILQEDNQFFYYESALKKDKSWSFEKKMFTPVGKSTGYMGVGEGVNGKTIVLRGANVILSESKKE